MRVFLCLGVALLFTLALADHHEGEHHDKDDHHDHKDGHQKKGKDHDKEHHHHHNEFMACHKIAKYNSKFAFDLYRQVALDHPSKNIVFSPVSISTALAFLSLGAKGQTHSQIIEGTRFNASELSEQEMHDGFHHLLVLLNDVNREVQLSGGNALFISQKHKILQEFLDDAKKLYHAEAFSTDFENNEEAKNQINSYVNKNTNGKITDLLDSVDKEAIFILINYIYFKAKWENPFLNELTKDGDFHVNENTTVKVPFMSRIGYYKAAVTEEATVVSLPYKGEASALFIMPKEGKLSEVEQNLNTDSILKWKKLTHRSFVDLFLPKFSITGTIDLKTTLGKMGIVDVFSDSADLSGITEGAKAKLSKAVHKAVLSVNEQGTEAAGVTALEGVPMMLPITVKFDHPYILTLYDHKAKSVLFSARIANPMQ
ncbi:alpha-1-antiproteinase-like [Anomaloglossus baeobatrachus]|uniref:alpha-1-antiproteinase-like n=1 Tax=Anomaloglossus baeobatrachus TaxID=238106 RepID=UPI003F5090D8